MTISEGSSTHLSVGVSEAVWHALVWLVVGNAIGVMLAVLLLLPGLNPWLGEWTYGRWMMVHMNTALFGWCGLPVVGFLFKVYGADRGALAVWCRPIMWLWSGALLVGSFSWLSGSSSGKLFLDWTGYPRVLFPLALGTLWVLLTIGFLRGNVSGRKPGWQPAFAKATGLVVLISVPFAIYFASSPNVYAYVNPETGGPTGTSQLESSLGIVLILLAVPYGLTQRLQKGTQTIRIAWAVFLMEAAVCATLQRSDLSHRIPAQFLSLGSIVVWLFLIPAYYREFQWNAGTRRWHMAFLWWWATLVITGWVFFLPGILDRFKFTDGLVGHSLTAVAGFLTAFLVFVMIQLIGEDNAWIFNRSWSFYAWNFGVLAYVCDMTVAGWIEGSDPAFTIVPGPLRNTLYFIRLVTGLAMLAGSLEWLVSASSLPSVVSRTELNVPEVEAA